jgi:hypothetical protein
MQFFEKAIKLFLLCAPAKYLRINAQILTVTEWVIFNLKKITILSYNRTRGWPFHHCEQHWWRLRERIGHLHEQHFVKLARDTNVWNIQLHVLAMSEQCDWTCLCLVWVGRRQDANPRVFTMTSPTFHCSSITYVCRCTWLLSFEQRGRPIMHICFHNSTITNC